MIKSFADKIENIFGYSKTSEVIISYLYGLTALITLFPKLKHSKGKKIFISLGLPGYLENIIDVLKQLSAKGHSIHIFPEWKQNIEFDFKLQQLDISYFNVHFNFSRVLPLLKCDIFLSSVAGKNYFFPICPFRLFYFHSTAGMEGFPDRAVDSYSHILVATKQQFEQLNLLNKSKDKCIYPIGYPKLDQLRAKLTLEKFHSKKKDVNSRIRIIYAPTYVDDNIYNDISIFYKSLHIIKFLILNNYDVTFRPHPLLFKRDKSKRYIEEITASLNDDFFHLDTETSYYHTYLNSDIMITDVSGTSLNYRLAFQKPVIFFTNDINKATKAFSLIPELGITCDEIEKLPDLIKILCAENLSAEIPNAVFNLDKSVEKFVELIDSIAHERH